MDTIAKKIRARLAILAKAEEALAAEQRDADAVLRSRLAIKDAHQRGQREALAWCLRQAEGERTLRAVRRADKERLAFWLAKPGGKAHVQDPWRVGTHTACGREIAAAVTLLMVPDDQLCATCRRVAHGVGASLEEVTP